MPPLKRPKQPSPVYRARIRRCRALMKRAKVSAYLLTDRMDGFYLTGFTGEDSAVLVLPKGVHLISDGRFEESIRQECPWATTWLRKGLLIPEIGSVCRKLKLRQLSIQEDRLSVADRSELAKRAKGTRLAAAPSIVADMRVIKDDYELAILRKAIRNAEAAFVAMKSSIRVGQTELEMAARLEYEMKCRGASGPSFATICAEGPNAALPHAHPGRRKVKKGSAILFDWGARLGMYCSDLTRMVFVGSIPRKLENVYETVRKAQEAAIKAIRPGRRMCDVDKVARSLIESEGFGGRFNHGLGHGLGLNVHEAPSLSWRSDQKLRKNMFVTVEPGIYLPRVGGVRIEDDVVVTADGCRVLSKLGKKLKDALI